MSDTTGTLPARVDKDDAWVELASFRGKNDENLKAFSFYIPQIKSVEGAVRHLTRAGVNGADLVVALVNSTLNYRARTKAASKLPEDKNEIKKRALSGDTLLISAEEAFDFSPGERELSSDISLMKAQKENLKLAREAKDKGDMAKAHEYMEKAKTLWQQIQERQMASFSLD